MLGRRARPGARTGTTSRVRPARIAAALAERRAAPRAAAGRTAPGPRRGSARGAATSGRPRWPSDYDAQRGGFGGAPKFPPSMVLEFLLRHSERTGAGRQRRPGAAMAAGTAEAMARGGIYDQLGGGFARYSVDADWVVPHFEKMLYDNALLAGSTRTVAAHRRRRWPAGSPRRPATG